MLYGAEAQINLLGQMISQPYAPRGVHFAGSIQAQGPTYLSSTSNLSCTDNGLLSFSYWVNGLDSAANNNAIIWVVDPVGQYENYHDLITVSAVPCYHEFSLRDVPSAHQYYTRFPPLSGSGWHHLLGSWEIDHAAGSKTFALYFDDVLQTAYSIVDADPSFFPAFNGYPFFFADDTFSDGPTCDFADVWIAPGLSLIDETAGTISEETRRLFTSYTTGIGLEPIDPHTFPSSAILFTGGPTAFAVNQGTGGAFTLTGSLTDAATAPP